MNNKHTNRFDQHLSQFIFDCVNVSTFSCLMLPLLQVDTTSVKNLAKIYQQTEDDNSQIGRQLNFKSQKLLNFYNEVQNQYSFFEDSVWSKNKKKLPFQQIKPKSQSRVMNDNIKSKQKERKNHQLNLIENNQNIDRSNLQTKPQSKNHDKPSKNIQVNLYTDFKQIIRPEYRKQIGSQSYREQALNNNNKETFNRTNQKETIMQRARPKYEYIQTSESCDQMIPVVKNNRKNNQYLMRDKQLLQKSSRSVSPKVERSKKMVKNQINSISQISGNVQTGSDLSFQIDLNSMGIFSNDLQVADSRYNKNNRENYIISGHQNYKRQQVKGINNNITQNARANYIEEEQPWECDEEQIEDEIRQLNEKLINGQYQTQRYRTEIDDQIQTDPIKIQSISSSNRQTFRQTKTKEVKTVRLSLTPSKKKDVSHRKVQTKYEQPKIKKVTYKDYPISKFPSKRKQQRYKQQQYLVQRQQDSTQQIQCAKWNRPKHGLIKVDIQKYMKQK